MGRETTERPCMAYIYMMGVAITLRQSGAELKLTLLKKPTKPEKQGHQHLRPLWGGSSLALCPYPPWLLLRKAAPGSALALPPSLTAPLRMKYRPLCFIFFPFFCGGFRTKNEYILKPPLEPCRNPGANPTHSRRLADAVRRQAGR